MSGQGHCNDLDGISNVSMHPTKRKFSEIQHPRNKRSISEDEKTDNDCSSMYIPKPSTKKGHVAREAESSNGKRSSKKQCVASIIENKFEAELEEDGELIFWLKLKGRSRSRRSDCEITERSSKDAGVTNSEPNNATLCTSSAMLSSSPSSVNNNSNCSIRNAKVIHLYIPLC